MKIFFILLILSSNIFAAPVMYGDRVFFQSDGQSFIAEAKGDEYFSWLEDSLGRVIQFNSESSNFEYSVINESNGVISLGFSGVAAADNLSLYASPFSIEEIGIINRLKLYIIASEQRDALLQEAKE